MNLKIFMIVIGLVNPEEPEAFDHYVTSMRDLYASVGAEIIGRYPVFHVAVGEEKPDFVLIVEFPNEETLRSLSESADYKTLVPYRDKAFKNLTVYLSKDE